MSLIRNVKQIVWREIPGLSYKRQAGLRKTIWFLFIPVFSTTDWTIEE